MRMDVRRENRCIQKRTKYHRYTKESRQVLGIATLPCVHTQNNMSKGTRIL